MRIALGFGDLFGPLNAARRFAHSFTSSPSSTSHLIASAYKWKSERK
jgi:hypothetical protein